MVLKEGLEKKRPSVHGCNVPVHTQSTPERCEVNSTGEHLLPLPFFFLPKLPYGYFKMRIWHRDTGQTKLNFDWETETCVGMGGATYNQ